MISDKNKCSMNSKKWHNTQGTINKDDARIQNYERRATDGN